MDSPSTIEIRRSLPRSHRKPLQPRNSPVVVGRPAADPKPKWSPGSFRTPPPRVGGGGADKENRLPGTAAGVLAAAGVGPMDTSLAEELGAVRRQRERLKSERERTEELLAERGRLLDRAVREVGRRWEEQRRVELGLRRLIGLRALGSPCETTPTFQSLREREQEKRNKNAQSQVGKNEKEEKSIEKGDDAESSRSKELVIIQSSGDENSPSFKS